jgi:hypothetical protein
VAREIRTHVELAGIARRPDWLGHSKKFEFIAELRIAAPADEQTRGCRSSFALDSIDSSWKRNVAKPFGVTLGSDVTKPTAVATRGRSVNPAASRRPAVSRVPKL